MIRKDGGLNFPIVDFVIAIVVIIGAIMGSMRGFLRSLLKLGSLVLSAFFAYILTGEIIKITGNWFGIKAGALAIFDAIFKLIIIIILFCIFEAVFIFMERRIVKSKPTGGPAVGSRVLGLSIGVVKAIAMVVVFLILIKVLFPGENPVTLQIERSVVGRFLFEKNPLVALAEGYLN